MKIITHKISREALENQARLLALAFFGERTICVMRDFEGKPAALKLDNQKSFSEWNGCFSLYNFSRGKQ